MGMFSLDPDSPFTKPDDIKETLATGGKLFKVKEPVPEKATKFVGAIPMDEAGIPQTDTGLEPIQKGMYEFFKGALGWTSLVEFEDDKRVQRTDWETQSNFAANIGGNVVLNLALFGTTSAALGASGATAGAGATAGKVATQAATKVGASAKAAQIAGITADKAASTFLTLNTVSAIKETASEDPDFVNYLKSIPRDALFSASIALSQVPGEIFRNDPAALKSVVSSTFRTLTKAKEMGIPITPNIARKSVELSVDLTSRVLSGGAGATISALTGGSASDIITMSLISFASGGGKYLATRTIPKGYLESPAKPTVSQTTKPTAPTPSVVKSPEIANKMVLFNSKTPTISDAIKSNGNYTVDINGNSIVTGYSIGVAPGRTAIIPDASLTSTGINTYADSVSDLLAKPGNFLNATNDGNGNVILEVVKNVPKPIEALDPTNPEESLYAHNFNSRIPMKDLLVARDVADKKFAAIWRYAKAVASRVDNKTISKEDASKDMTTLLGKRFPYPTKQNDSPLYSQAEDLSQAAMNLLTPAITRATMIAKEKNPTKKKAISTLFDTIAKKDFIERMVRLETFFGDRGITPIYKTKDMVDYFGTVQNVSGFSRVNPSLREVLLINPNLTPEDMPMIHLPHGKSVPAISKYGFLGDKDLEKQLSTTGVGNDKKVSLYSDNLKSASEVFDGQKVTSGAGYGALAKFAFAVDRALIAEKEFISGWIGKFKAICKDNGLYYGGGRYLSPVDGQILTYVSEGEPVPEDLMNSTNKPIEVYKKAAKDFKTASDEIRKEHNVFLEAIGREPMGYIENYVPHFQAVMAGQKNIAAAMVDLSNIQEIASANEAFTKHTIERTPDAAPENLEKNFYKLWDAWIKETARDMHRTPIIGKTKAIIQQLKGAGATVMPEFLDRFAKENLLGQIHPIDASIGLSSDTLPRKIMEKIMLARTTAALTLNIAWMLFTQPSSMAITYALGGFKPFMTGIFKWFASPKTRIDISQMSTMRIKGANKVAATGMGDLDHESLSLYTTPMTSARDLGGLLTNTLEHHLTAMSISVGFELGKSLKLTGEDLDIFAMRMGEVTQSMYNRESKPLLNNSRLFTFVAPFSTYAFECFRLAKRIIGNGGGTPNAPRVRVGMLINLIVATIALNAIQMRLRGKPLQTPGSYIPAVGGLVDMGINKLLDSVFLDPKAKKALSYVGIAPGTTGGKAPIAPLTEIDYLSSAVKNWIEYGDISGIRNELIKWGTGMAGIPGGIQITRVVDGLIAAEKGYVEDLQGKMKLKIEGIDKVIMPILGVGVTRAKVRGQEKSVLELELELELKKRDRERIGERKGLRVELRKLYNAKPKEKAAMLLELSRKDPERVKALVAMAKAELVDYSNMEKIIARFGIEDGSRAMAIHKVMKEVKNDKAKLQFVTDLYEKGIATDTVVKQLMFLMSREEKPEPKKGTKK
jgi:hypothetical protein